MKYDSYDDFFFFVIGASIASGRTFWAGKNTPTNKYLKDEDVEINITTRDGVQTTSIKRVR